MNKEVLEAATHTGKPPSDATVNGTNAALNGSTGIAHHSPPPTTNDGGAETNWHTPGPAAYDFCSDTATSPTASMLRSIQQTTLLDDVFGADPTTNEFESYVASLTGHPSALLVLSGTMGNQLAIRAHLSHPPHALLTDHRSHILNWEAGGAATLSQAVMQSVTPANGTHMTLEDVQREIVLSSDVHKTPTRLIALENTLGGAILPLRECRRISAYAKSLHPPVPVHLDGARLWEAVAALVARKEPGFPASLAAGLKAYGDCFDSMSLCFSKGLGAPIGSMLVGRTHEFTTKARHVRKSIGGGLRATGIVAAPARVSVDETFFGGRLLTAQHLTQQVGAMWTQRGGKVVYPVETNMVWFDLEGSTQGEWDAQRFIACGQRHGVRLLGGRVVCHYQVCDEAVARLGAVMDEVLGKKA